jgi:hypothetical protein
MLMGSDHAYLREKMIKVMGEVMPAVEECYIRVRDAESH